MMLGGSPLRSAIVGAGFIGGVHGRAVQAAGGVVAGVADTSPERAAALAERLHATAASDPGQLITSADVDLVHVCTPNVTHAPLVEQAIAAGKHVICEKPLAVSAKEAERLSHLAADKGVVTAVPFVYRYYPLVRRLRSEIASGAAGRVTTLHGSYLQDWLGAASDSDWRIDPQRGGASRAFGDIGVHWVDLAEFVTGDRVARLCAQTQIVFPRRGTGAVTVEVSTEDVAVVNFVTATGAVGTVVLSQVALGHKNRFTLEVDGTGATLRFDHDDPEHLWVGRRDAVTLLSREPEDAGRTGRSALPAGHPHGYQDCFADLVADCHAAIRGPERPAELPSFADGLRAAEVTEAVLASAAAGCWIELS